MTGTSVHINTDHYSSVRPFIRPFRQSDILNNRLTEEKIWNWILLADVTRVLSSKAFKHFLISVKGLGRNIYGKIRSDKTVWTIVKRRLRYLLRSLRPAIVVDDTYYYQLLSTEYINYDSVDSSVSSTPHFLQSGVWMPTTLTIITFFVVLMIVWKMLSLKPQTGLPDDSARHRLTNQ